MIIIVPIMLLAGLLAVGLVFMLAVRTWTYAGALTNAPVRSTDTLPDTYALPHGQDPAVLIAALAGEGFVSVIDLGPVRSRLLIECAETDRAKVRSIIDHIDHAGLDGAGTHPGPVRFDDETEVA